MGRPMFCKNVGIVMRKNMPKFGWKIFVEVKDFPKKWAYLS